MHSQFPWRGLIGAAALLTLVSPFARAADETPEWVRLAAAAQVPQYAAKINSVVVFQEEAVTVQADGRRIVRERGAIRIIQPGDDLRAYRSYNTKDGRIRDFQGWLIPVGGKPVPYAKNRVIDLALSQQFTYDEGRAKVLECGGAAAGATFAWEVTDEERTLLTQYVFPFQGRLPVIDSRFVLTLPPGWEAKGVIMNHAGFEPLATGATWTWELRDLAPIEREPHSPTLSALAPRLAVSYFPSEDNRAGLHGLKDWPAVSGWLTPLTEPAAEPSDAVRAKAASLIAGITSEIDRIRSIGRFVQKTNYVEVALNITHGGGYTPHPADVTLSRNYGDCKDKATLMRALLKAAGIDSYLVVISADDRTFVRPEWASPQQFNHAIVAVDVPDSIDFPAVANTPLGRLLFFDPTDPITAVGTLPKEEQGSYALIVAGTKGALVISPAAAPSADRVDSTVTATVDLDGSLDAKIDRLYFGQSAVPLRWILAQRGNDELKKRMEAEVSRPLGGSTVEAVTADLGREDRLGIKLDLKAKRFGQMMQGRLFVIRPGLAGAGEDYFFPSRQRTQPVKLESEMKHESIHIRIPAELKLDELPPPQRLESAWGTLDAKWELLDGEVVMTSTVQVNATIAPVADYARVRDFFDHVAGVQSAAVVFVNQSRP